MSPPWFRAKAPDTGHAGSVDGRARRAWLQALGAGGALSLLGAAGWQFSPGRSPGLADPVELAGEVCIVAPLRPGSADPELAIDAPRAVPADARCPVCGMYPARHPERAAQAIYDDGATHFFDSPLDLMLYLREVPRHVRGRTVAELRALYVTDAAAGPGHWIDARRAWLVPDSRSTGQAHHAALAAFASRQAAEAFGRPGDTPALPWSGWSDDRLRRLDIRHRHPG